MGVEIAAIRGKLILEDGFSSPSDKLLGLIPKLTSAIDALVSKIDKIGNKPVTPKSAPDEVEKLKTAYERLSAKIDPVVAGEQKLTKASEILEAAHKKGLITHDQFLAQLDKAKTKFSDTVPFAEKLGDAVGNKLSDKFKLLGEFASRYGGEAGEVLEHVSAKAEGAVSSLTELASHLGPLLPLAVALAAALLAVGVGFKAFEFIKDAVAEGLVLQGVIERLNDSLRNTGSYSGLSSHEIIELAGSYALLTGRTKEQVVQGALVLTHFRHLTEESYPRALDATLAYAKAMGVTADEAARKLGPILDGNTRSLRGLKEAGVDLTKGQLLTLNQMVETGHIVEYQNLLFDILREKVGKAADQFDGNLTRQAGRAKFVLGELKEGIASELIPALEDLGIDIINQLGGWDSLKNKATAFGHVIGDTLRAGVYILIIGFHELRAAWDRVAIAIDRGILSVLGHVRDFADAMSLIPGLGSAWTVVSIGLNKAMASVSDSLAKDNVSLVGNIQASNEAAVKWVTHRQALEGDTKAYKNHGSAQDEVASKTKAEKDLLDGLSDTLRKVEAARAALDLKSKQELSDTELLLSARLRGNDAYENERVRLEGIRKERELLAPLEKLEEEVKAKLADTVKNLSDKYGENSSKVREARADALGEIAVIDATIESIKRRATQISIDTAVTLDWAKGQKTAADAAHAWAEQVTHDFRVVLDAKTELNKKLQEAFQIATVNAPTIHLQNIEVGYIEWLKTLHGKTEEETRRFLANQASIEGKTIEQLIAEIKGMIGALDDARTLQSIKGASKTPYDIYKEERDNIVRVMEETTHNVSLTVEQRAQIERDGNAALLALDRERYESILSNAAGALDFLAARFGSFFAQLKSLVDGLQQAQGFGKNVSGLVSGFGGSGQLAGAAGGVATVVGIFAVVYDFVDKMIKARNALKMGTLSSLEVVGGNWSSPSYFDETGRKFDVALRNLITSILDSIHGVLTDLPQITIRARADGKKFAAYVAGVFIGEFNSAQEAMENAVAAAIASGKFTNLSEELKRALEASIGKTLDELQANIKTANDAIADRLGELGNSFVENIDKYLQRIEAERKLGLSTEATTQAMIRSIEAYKNQILGIDTTASDRLAALRSLDAGMKEASGSIEAELQKRINDVMAQIAALEAQARHPGVPGSSGGSSSGGAGGSGFNEKGGGRYQSPEDAALAHLREVLRQYTDELEKIPRALTDQQINMGIFDTLYQYLQQSPKYAKQAAEWAKIKVQIEFEQIKAQLMLLGKWEEFQAMFNDAYNAALAAAGKTPGKGGRGGGKKDDSVQSFIDDRRFQLQLAGMDAYHQRLAQIQRDYDEQIKAAGKNTKQKQELLALEAQEIALAKQQNQADVMSRFNELIGKNDAFTQIQIKFDGMADSLKNTGFGAKRLAGLLADLSKAEAEAIHTLAQQDLGNLFSNLSNYIEDQTTKQQALTSAAQIKYQLDMINYKADFELLKSKHVLTQKEIEQVQSLFDYIEAHPPDFTVKSQIPNTYEYGQAVLQDQQNYLASIGKDAASIKSAMDLLRSYQEDSEDALTKQLNKIRADFGTISTALGNTAEVIATKNQAISRAISDFLEPVKSFRQQMDLAAGTSTLTGAQQFSSIQSQFRALVGHATLADRDRLLDLAGQYRDIARQATVGQGYRFIDQEIKNALDSFSSMVGTQAGAQLGTGTNPMSMAAPQLQQAVELGNSMIVSQLRSQNDTSAQTNVILYDINQRLAGGLTTRNVA